MITPAPILERSELATWRQSLPAEQGPLVLTNGCFDLLHPGHVTYLTQARNLGGFLIVAVNADASVRALKGPARPIHTAADRCAVLAGLRCVDALVVFEEPRVTGVIEEVRPDIYAKGGDYTLETLDPGEAAALRACGARVELLSLVPGKSTSSTLARLQAE
jgi:rfaE bifunctional protein nucleotidyltransferase chain/domain